MIEKFLKANSGKSASTQATDRFIIKKLKETWPYDIRMRV